MKLIYTLLLAVLTQWTTAQTYSPEVWLYIDSTKTIEEEAYVSGAYDSLFYPVANGFTTKNKSYNYVIKFFVKNDTTFFRTKWVSNYQTLIGYRSLLYKAPHNQVVKQEIGYLLFGSEGHQYARPNFSVIVPPKDSVAVYLFTRGFGGRSNLDVHISDNLDFKDKNEASLLFQGAFYGILVIILAINLLYFALFRDKVFIIYGLSVFLAILFYSMFDGVFLFGLLGQLGIWYIPLSMFSIISYYTFLPVMAFYYLRMNNGHFMGLKKVLLVYGCIVLVALVVPFINHSDNANAFYFFYYILFCLVGFVLLLITGYLGRNVEPYLSRNFLIAYLVLFVFSVLPFLDLIDGFNSGLGMNWFKVGTIVELTILSFTLSVRFKRTEDLFNLVRLEYMNLQEMFFRSQINPHFLFNVLGSINSYINNNDQENASTYLLKFSKLIRLVLESTKLDRIVLKDELEMIRTYVELEQLRNDRFDFEIQVDQQIDQEQMRIPAMLVQPYIENAIKHGLRDVEYRGKINLSIDKKEDTLVVRVEDNGIGIENSKTKTSLGGTKIGMKNVSNRIQVLQQKLGIDFEVKSEQKNKPDHGTMITLELPVN